MNIDQLRIEELTTPAVGAGSIRYGRLKDRPDTLYMFVGPIPEFVKIGKVKVNGRRGSLIRKMRRAALAAQQLSTSIFAMDRSVRPKSYQDFAQMVKSVVLPE